VAAAAGVACDDGEVVVLLCFMDREDLIDLCLFNKFAGPMIPDDQFHPVGWLAIDNNRLLLVFGIRDIVRGIAIIPVSSRFVSGRASKSIVKSEPDVAYLADIHKKKKNAGVCRRSYGTVFR
jgi:hypothetical protein